MAVPCMAAVHVAAQRPDAGLISDDNLLTSSHLPAGEANGNEAGGDGTKQPGDDGKGATAGDAKPPGDDAKEATADDATKADEPDAKRQATDAVKAELAADAPIGGGPKPSNVIEEGRIYFIYRCKCVLCTLHTRGQKVWGPQMSGLSTWQQLLAEPCWQVSAL